MTHTSRAFLLIAVLVPLAFAAQAQEVGAPRLSGVWTGHERDGSPGGKLSFGPGNKMSYSFDGFLVEGSYEINFAKSPKVLAFYPDIAPGKKLFALIRIGSDGGIEVSHLSDDIPVDWVGQDVVAFARR